MGGLRETANVDSSIDDRNQQHTNPQWSASHTHITASIAAAANVWAVALRHVTRSIASFSRIRSKRASGNPLKRCKVLDLMQRRQRMQKK